MSSIFQIQDDDLNVSFIFYIKIADFYLFFVFSLFIHKKTLIEILKKQNNKKPKELQFLVNATQQIPIFQNYIEQGKEDIHYQLCECLYYEFHKKDSIIFEIDSKGDKFYIILKGKVLVLTKNEEALFHQQQIQSQQQHTHQRQSQSHIFLKPTLILTTGNSFGELSLIKNLRRQATIQCLEDCHVAVIDKHNFDIIMKDQEQKKFNAALQYLSSLEIFKNLSEYSIRKLHVNSKQYEAQRNSIIYQEGDQAQCFYIIKNGNFSIIKKFEVKNDDILHQYDNSVPEQKIVNSFDNKLSHKEIKIADLTQNNYFGHEEIIKNQKRKFSIKCDSINAQLIIINLEDFKDRVLIDDSTYNYFIASINQQNQLLEQRMIEIQEHLDKYKNFLCNPTYKQRKVKTVIVTNQLQSAERCYTAQNFRNDSVVVQNESSIQQRPVFLSEEKRQNEKILSKNNFSLIRSDNHDEKQQQQHNIMQYKRMGKSKVAMRINQEYPNGYDESQDNLSQQRQQEPFEQFGRNILKNKIRQFVSKKHQKLIEKIYNVKIEKVKKEKKKFYQSPMSKTMNFFKPISLKPTAFQLYKSNNQRILKINNDSAIFNNQNAGTQQNKSSKSINLQLDTEVYNKFQNFIQQKNKSPQLLNESSQDQFSVQQKTFTEPNVDIKQSEIDNDNYHKSQQIPPQAKLNQSHEQYKLQLNSLRQIRIKQNSLSKSNKANQQAKQPNQPFIERKSSIEYATEKIKNILQIKDTAKSKKMQIMKSQFINWDELFVIQDKNQNSPNLLIEVVNSNSNQNSRKLDQINNFIGISSFVTPMSTDLIKQKKSCFNFLNTLTQTTQSMNNSETYNQGKHKFCFTPKNNYQAYKKNVKNLILHTSTSVYQRSTTSNDSQKINIQQFIFTPQHQQSCIKKPIENKQNI